MPVTSVAPIYAELAAALMKINPSNQRAKDWRKRLVARCHSAARVPLEWPEHQKTIQDLAFEYNVFVVAQGPSPDQDEPFSHVEAILKKLESSAFK